MGASDVRAGGAYVSIWGDLGPLTRSLAKGRQQIQKWGQGLMMGGGMMAGVGAAMAMPLKMALDSLGIQEAAESKLAAMLKSTGNAAGYTADQLKEMAREMQRLTAYGDEEIITAQAILGSFVNIGKKVFPDAIEATANLATLFGTDLKSTAIQLGKALNDPAVGLNAMVRSGVSFSKMEKELIMNLWNAGKQMEAQTYIIKALNDQGMGGQAQAQLSTYSGLVKAIGNDWSDAMEEIGRAIRPSRELAETIRENVRAFGDWIREHPGAVKAFAAVSAALLVIGSAAMVTGIAMLFLTSASALWIGIALGLALAATYVADTIFGVETSMVSLMEGFRVGTQSMQGWFEILGANLNAIWQDFKVGFLTGLASMSKFFWGAISQWGKWLAALADKLGMDDVADKMRGFADNMKDYNPYADAIAEAKEESKYAHKDAVETATKDSERLKKKEAKNYKITAKGLAGKGPAAPTLPEKKGPESGVLSALGSANFAERLGALAASSADEQLDVSKDMASSLKAIEKNTTTGVTATLG